MTVVGLYGQASNIEYTNDASKMLAIENMDISQILLHFLIDDIPNQPLCLCLTGIIHGLLAVAVKNNGSQKNEQQKHSESDSDSEL